jgi:hypothetical protein
VSATAEYMRAWRQIDAGKRDTRKRRLIESKACAWLRENAPEVWAQIVAEARAEVQS